MNAKRIAVVTGGTTGLGAAITLALLEQGRTVVATYYPGDLNACEALPEWSVRMKEAGHDVFIFPVDVTDPASCEALIARVNTEVGVPLILVNNAGITRDAPLHKMTFAQWNAVIMTNLNSFFTMTRPVIEGMRAAKWGRIVSISSVNGEKGQFGQANYAAAKAGIIAATKSVAAENAKYGVTVNAVAPGYIATDMVMAIKEEVRTKIVEGVPVGRLGEPSEIGRVVQFLTSDDAGLITGSTIDANGGLYYR